MLAETCLGHLLKEKVSADMGVESKPGLLWFVMDMCVLTKRSLSGTFGPLETTQVTDCSVLWY